MKKTSFSRRSCLFTLVLCRKPVRAYPKVVDVEVTRGRKPSGVASGRLSTASPAFLCSALSWSTVWRIVPEEKGGGCALASAKDVVPSSPALNSGSDALYSDDSDSNASGSDAVSIIGTGASFCPTVATKRYQSHSRLCQDMLRLSPSYRCCMIRLPTSTIVVAGR